MYTFGLTKLLYSFANTIEYARLCTLSYSIDNKELIN